MYDAYLVEQGTLKNDVVDGKVGGFSFGVRVSNYRGIYLSLVNGFYVKVDGVEYPREIQTYEINGKPPRPLSETIKSVWEHWALTMWQKRAVWPPASTRSDTWSARLRSTAIPDMTRN